MKITDAKLASIEANNANTPPTTSSTPIVIGIPHLTLSADLADCVSMAVSWIG
jgi:hypothetical protein